MIKTIKQATKTDAELARLLDEAREYAQIYLLAKQRHKGCQGTGELMTLKEEFKDTIDRMSAYCRERRYLRGPLDGDVDAVADALLKQHD